MSDLIIPHHFEARDYQIPFLHAVAESMAGRSPIRRFYQIWHRRSGKDKSNIADVVPRRLIQDPCLVKYVFPTLVMGRDNLWDGIGRDGFRYMNHIPEAIRVGRANESRMSVPVNNNFYNPDQENHSLFQVAGSNYPDSLRGGNPKLFVLSEWADQDPYALDVIDPIVKENDGIIIFNTTPKGNNHARSLFDFAKSDPNWYVSVLTAHDTGVFTLDQLAQIKDEIIRRFAADGRSEEEALAYFEQEYLCSFDSPVIGSYYGAAIRKAEADHRIGRVPYERILPVHTAWDLGVDDSMTIWFFQTVGGELRIIDYYENNGEGIEFYIKQMNQKEYVYGQHFAPHDIAVQEMGTGKTRWEVAKSLGVRFEIAPRLDVDEGINAVRSLFSQMWFDSEKCYRGLNCLKNYKKKWNEKMKVFSSTADHNWASHGADALRTLALMYRHPRRSQQQPQQGFGGIKPLIPGVG